MDKFIIKLLPVESVIPSGNNKRGKLNLKSADFVGLKESIASCGVNVPIQVRLHPTIKTSYELIAGERRWTACKELALSTIPAIVYSGLTDAEAVRITYIENKFRLGLPPIEESAEVDNLLIMHNGDAAAVGSLLGKSSSWVMQRSVVCNQLTKKWVKAVTIDEDYANYTIAHLVLMARLPWELQDAFLENEQCRDVSVKDLEKGIERYLKLLSKAPWDINDETLVPTSGACSTCIQRSSNNSLLWEDDTPEKATKNDRCLNPKCWEKKITAYVKQRSAKFADEHKNLIYLSSCWLGTEDPVRSEYGKVYTAHDVTKKTKTTKDALPALLINGLMAGSIIWVVLNRSYSSPKKAKSKDGKPVQKTLKEKMALLDLKRWSQVLKNLQEVLRKSLHSDLQVPQSVIPMSMVLIRMVNRFGFSCQEVGNWENILDDKYESRLVLKTLWEGIKPELNYNLEWKGPLTQVPESMIAEAKVIAKLLAFDIDADFKQVSELKGFTVPKSWEADKKQAADKPGLKKKTVKTKKK